MASLRKFPPYSPTSPKYPAEETKPKFGFVEFDPLELPKPVITSKKPKREVVFSINSRSPLSVVAETSSVKCELKIGDPNEIRPSSIIGTLGKRKLTSEMRAVPMNHLFICRLDECPICEECVKSMISEFDNGRSDI